MLLFDIALMFAGLFVTILAGPIVVRRIAVAGTLLVLACFIVLAINGFPLMRKRVGRVDAALTPRVESAALTLHRDVGFLTEGAFSFMWPCLITLPFRSRAGRVRRIVLTAASSFLFLFFALVAVTAYLLPRTGSIGLPISLAETILRFTILHVTVGPALVVLFLIAVLISRPRTEMPGA